MCKSHNQHIKWLYGPNILLMCAKTQPTAINTSHVIAKYVLETNMPIKLGIYTKYLIDSYGRSIHMCATYEVTSINHVTVSTVYILDIYHYTNMVATLHMHVQVHYYCSAPIDPTLVHT